jgi:hypothetical protein
MAGSLARALAVAALAGGLAACSATPGPPAGPAASAAASPGQVAREYLRAAVAANCKVTAELTLSHTWSWCDDPRLLDYRSVASPLHVPASEAGRDEECVPFEMHTKGSSDGSMPVGWAPWELCFTETAAGWRLYDQGQG